jgi:hypothetical protein
MLYSRVGDTEITRKSRGVKKARFLPGDGDARNRFIRCQFCGFIIDTKKIQPPQPRSSINITESNIKEQVFRCEEEILYYYLTTESLELIEKEILTTESLDPINTQDSQLLRRAEEIVNTEILDPIDAQDSYEILFPYKLPYPNPILPVLTGGDGQYILIEGDNIWHYYIQYGPIEHYEITSNCPFCGAQYTK